MRPQFPLSWLNLAVRKLWHPWVWLYMSLAVSQLMSYTGQSSFANELYRWIGTLVILSTERVSFPSVFDLLC
jgi:hypothetical protein